MQMRAGVLALLSTAAVWGSSSGLNNIPTTDTAGHRVILFQDYATLGSGSTTTSFVAFQTGFDFLAHTDSPLRLEWGMDGRTNPAEGSAVLLQGKLAFQPASKGPAFCLGIANIAATQTSRALNGDPYSYAVLSWSAGIARLHGGYALQAHGNNSAILGIDRAVKVAGAA